MPIDFSKLRKITAREWVRALERDGFELRSYLPTKFSSSPQKLIAELDQEDVRRKKIERVEELIGGVLVEEETPGEVERIDIDVALARL